jgi:ABC-2 type transport system ATP-binding protein
VIWFCGGHGVCLDPVTEDEGALLKANALAWLEQYVKGTGSAADAIPNFQFYDQLGDYYSSGLLPYEPGFNDDFLTGTSTGGLLPIVPIIGGSNGTGGLYGLGGGSRARNAINVPITVGVGTQVVGAPTVTFDYRGIGTTRAVFAQVINDATGQVLGNVITPLPVTLDGRSHSLELDLSDIVYTFDPAGEGNLTVQITSSAAAFENFTSFGFMNISNVIVTMPNRPAV